MQIKPRSYPHPVLSHFGDDIVGSVFQPTVTVKGTKTSYLFSAVFRTSNGDLRSLVEDKSAEYALHVECAATRYRSIFKSIDGQFSFEIPAHLLDGKVECCSFILATCDIADYRNSGAHADYAGLKFGVRKGDTLAVGPDCSFIAEKKIDPLRKIPSIFVVVPNENDDAASIDINATGDKIQVKLSKPNFDAYKFLSQAQPMHAALSSMIIVPALVALLEQAKEASASQEELASLESRRWYRVLVRALKDIGVDANDPNAFKDSSILLAQRLIGDPLSGGLQALQRYEQDEG